MQQAVKCSRQGIRSACYILNPTGVTGFRRVVVDKAGNVEGEDSPELKADDFELLCGDELLGELETLASVRAFFWKKSGDVTLDYRRKVQ